MWRSPRGASRSCSLSGNSRSGCAARAAGGGPGPGQRVAPGVYDAIDRGVGVGPGPVAPVAWSVVRSRDAGRAADGGALRVAGAASAGPPRLLALEDRADKAFILMREGHGLAGQARQFCRTNGLAPRVSFAARRTNWCSLRGRRQRGVRRVARARGGAARDGLPGAGWHGAIEWGHPPDRPPAPAGRPRPVRSSAAGRCTASASSLATARR